MDNTVPASICPGCGAANRCALAQGQPAESCWCMQRAATLPMPIDSAASCYCNTCLHELTAALPSTR